MKATGYAFWALVMPFLLALSSPAIAAKRCAEHSLDEVESVWMAGDLTLAQVNSRDSISRQAYLSDVNALERTLRRGYRGWFVHGAALKAAFERLRAVAGTKFSSQQVCELIWAELKQIPDGHLGVTYFDSRSCMDLPRLGRVQGNVTAKTWELIKSAKGSNIPVLAISNMAWRNSTEWNGFLETIEDLKQNAGSLIIDLRGNGGGDFEKVQQLARRLYGITDDAVELSPPSTQYLVQTPEGFALHGNSSLRELALNRLYQQPVSQGAQENLEFFRERYARALSGKYPNGKQRKTEAFDFDKAKVFKGPIRILVDAQCASSCEWALLFFARHPNAKVVGEKTAGAFQFDNVGMTWLPKTRLLVYVPTVAVEFDADYTVELERQGLQPDIPVRPGQDALDAAIRDITSQKP